MRVVRLSFTSAKQFLAHFSTDVDEGMVFCWTRAELEVHEPILAEIDFPELPSQVLLRAEVHALGKEHGAWLRLCAEDRTTIAFMLGIARGELEVHENHARRHERFPTSTPAQVTVAEEPSVVGTAEDVSTGGAFIRLNVPPEIGTTVRLELDSGDGPIEISGEVAWVREKSHGAPGVGIRFHQSEPGAQKLRRLLRQARETGTLSTLPN